MPNELKLSPRLRSEMLQAAIDHANRADRFRWRVTVACLLCVITTASWGVLALMVVAIQ